jgi:hypothetical protein
MFKDGKESYRSASDFMFDGSDAVEIRHDTYRQQQLVAS